MTDTHELLAPVTGFDRTIPSRVFLAPINTGFALQGRPTEDMLRFHQARSGPELGVSMVGNVAVSPSGIANAGTAVLDAQSALKPYCRIASLIRSRGSLAGIQLASSPTFRAKRNWVAKDVGGEEMRLAEILSTLPDSTLETILDNFVASARLAAAAGFEVIQIHPAHGYLLSLLLNPLTNRRSGRFALFGPWLRPFPIALAEAADRCIIAFRLSLFSGLTRSVQPEVSSAKCVSAILADAGVRFIDYSAGFYTVDRRLIYPGTEKGVLPQLSYALEAGGGLSCICGVSGNVQDLRAVPQLPSNFVVSLGRALIADSECVRKAKEGAFGDIRGCRRTGRCHYFSRGKRTIECGVNSVVAAQLTYE